MTAILAIHKIFASQQMTLRVTPKRLAFVVERKRRSLMMDHDARALEIRRKLTVAAGRTRRILAALPSDIRVARAKEIEAYLVQLKQWEGQIPGANFPADPPFARFHRMR